MERSDFSRGVAVGAAAGMAVLLLIVASWKKKKSSDEDKDRDEGSSPPYDFNRVIDRSAYITVKHDGAKMFFGDGANGALKLFVADMELPCCPAIQRALINRAQHPHFGYGMVTPELWDCVADWLVRKQHWSSKPKRESFAWSDTVTSGVANAVRALTEPGDSVLITIPGYPGLLSSASPDRRSVQVPLVRDIKSGRWTMDLDSGAMEDALRTCRAMVLCNPHNPTGRTWRAQELFALARLCAKHGVLVISDEIWADWCWEGEGHTFTPFRNVALDSGCSCVTVGAPTKTFSTAGVHAAFVVIEDPDLKAKYMRHTMPIACYISNTFGTTATMAAYEYGEPWLQAVKVHVLENIDYLVAYLGEHIPLIRVLRPEATYIVWLDCSGLQLSPSDLNDFMLNKAGLALTRGAEFGPEDQYGQWQRINVACSRDMLNDSLVRLKRAVSVGGWS